MTKAYDQTAATGPIKHPRRPGQYPSGPESLYRQALEQGFTADTAQQQAVSALEQIYQQLTQQRSSRSWLPWSRKRRAIKGLYLWGGVGRGKTWLMDLFFSSLPFAAKQRFHFHQFMNAIHHELKQLENYHDPLPQATARVVGDIRVLCFDEFFVTDIGDAMLLAGVLETLHERGISLVATSNVAPDDLYYDGLQRARFLPAIERLKNSARVMEIGRGDDYRLRALDRLNTYRVPHDAKAQQRLHDCFHELTANHTAATTVLLRERTVAAIQAAQDVAWFDFQTLCEGHRSASDYVELARSYHTILLSDIPVLGSERNDAARRFIHLIDALYDYRVKIIASAAAEPQALYQGKRLRKEFERTSSRLIEMRTRDYLAQAHRP